MDHKFHAAVEIVEKATHWTESGTKTLRAIAASEAFRKYNWIKNMPVKNVSGNFRGIVVSSGWGTTFEFSENILKPLEKVAVFASLAVNIMKANEEIHSILRSNETWAIKGSRISTEVTSISARTLAGAIPASAHVLAVSIGGYLQLGELAGLHQAARWRDRVNFVDATINATFEKVTDGNNIYLYIDKHFVMR